MINITSSKLACFSLLYANHDHVDMCKDREEKKNGEFNVTEGIWGLVGFGFFGWGLVGFFLLL